MMCVDTATEAPSVAVVRGERIVVLVRGGAVRSQTTALLAEIDAALREAGISLSEIELFAVACGPGSFAGLRAGLATIKAFAALGRKPVAAVPTLHAVACAAGASARTVTALVAGRGEVFAQLVSVGGSGEVEELNAPAHINPAKLAVEALNWGVPLKWAGGGAHAHAQLIREAAAKRGFPLGEEGVRGAGGTGSNAGGESWTLSRAADNYAAALGRLGLIRYQNNSLVGAENLRALYVRPSDAELNESCRA